MNERLNRIWFLLSVVLPLWIRTRKRPILFSRSGALGDILCTFPAALELKKRHPQATFIYSCISLFASLPKMAGVADLVTSVQFSQGSIWTIFFGAIYHFDYADERNVTPTESSILEFGHQHGVELDGLHSPLKISPVVTNKVKSLLVENGVHDNFILIHPGPTWPVREWPCESWSALVQKFHKEGLKNVVQLGSRQHAQLGNLAGIGIADVISLADKLNVEESVALISLSQFLVGVDSGLLHIAATLRVPAIGIFGATSPQFRFSPQSSCKFVVSKINCQGCHHRVPRSHWIKNCPHDVQCMKNISVDEVLQTCLSKLASSSLPESKSKI